MLLLALFYPSSAFALLPSTVGHQSNLYIGGELIHHQPVSSHIIGGGAYRDRFRDEVSAIAGCRQSQSCKGFEKDCRAVPYILSQVRCDKINGDTTTMLCDESAACKGDPATKCVHTFECESESKMFNGDTLWSEKERSSTPPRFRATAAHLRAGRAAQRGPLTDVSSKGHVHSAGWVLDKHKLWPPVEAVSYSNSLLAKARLSMIGSEESVPQAKLYPSEQNALDACQLSSTCGEKRPCEAREVEAERISADNSMWLWECSTDPAVDDNETHELNSFDSRTGMPQWTHKQHPDQYTQNIHGTGTKSQFGVGIRPSSDFQHPTVLSKMPLHDVVKEAQNKGIFRI
jgi:hypothetical protein